MHLSPTHFHARQEAGEGRAGRSESRPPRQRLHHVGPNVSRKNDRTGKWNAEHELLRPRRRLITGALSGPA
jgi:hypothetical protein